MTEPEKTEKIEINTGDAPTHSVIWLHGLGADGHDFVPLVPELGLPAGLSVRFIFPHAPRRPITINGGMVMRGWYDVQSIEFDRTQDREGIEQSAATVRSLIDAEIDRGINVDHIVVAGFSQGGAIALYSAVSLARRLAGFVALSTYLPLADQALADHRQENKPSPIFMAHGRHDPVVPYQLGRSSYEALSAAGFNIRWRDYPMEHAVNLKEIADLGGWFRAVLSGDAANSDA